MRNQTGSINWAALAATAASITAVAALITALLVYGQVREELQRARVRTGLDSLWHFTAEWDKQPMAQARSAAATALLDGRPDRDVDAVLDFFDEIGLLVDRQVLDEQLVWYEFYWPMANYWAASKEYVMRVRSDDPRAWDYVERAMQQLTTIEAQRKAARAELGPTRVEVREFLEAEVGQDACEPDQEADEQMTPL